jgi:light-regulated signal transduction histidine kinase (bacteriophytochrome)
MGPEEQVGAYAPIPGYGWAVVVQQPARVAFAIRNRTLATMATFYGAAMLLSALLAYVILSVIDRLKRVSNQLALANKELEAFSYSVSHDLRAPLRSIDGFSQALLEDYADKVDAEGKDHLQRIRGAAQRMADLIEALLTLSRVTRSEIHRTTLDLSGLARAIAAELQQREPGRQAEWGIQDDLAGDGDARLLRAVLENLLGNAWKFTATRAPARIEFGVWPGSNGRPTYFVRDNGAGFDMAYKDKLFGAFQRLHTQAEYRGTGIGLATVQRIIHRHGGRIWAEGAPEQGATFYFTLE